MNIYTEILNTIYTIYSSNLSDIHKELTKKIPITYTKFKTYIDKLETAGFIKTIDLILPMITGRQKIVLTTEKGELYAMNTCSEIIATKEAEKLIKMHTTLEHGYFIKNCINLFKNEGFEVYDTYEECRINTNTKTPKGRPKKIEADFIVSFENKKLVFECETGKCPEANLKKKLNCLKHKLNVLFILCPNAKAEKHTMNTIKKWQSINDENNAMFVVVLNASQLALKKNITERIMEYKEAF